MDPLVDELASIVGERGVRTEPLEVALYGRDGSMLEGAASVVVMPDDAAQVAAVVAVCHRRGRPFVPRGSGTGLAGGAVPAAGSVVICCSKMDRLLSVEPDDRAAWVEPGILNLDLSRQLAPWGLHFAPDPSSQAICSVGGNVANNSGGPHCLAYGVTSAHVLAVELVLADGEVVVLGGLDPEPPGYDLRGVVVGSEGTLGVVTRVAVRLTPDAPAVRTLLCDFPDPASGARAVTGIIAAGIIPAAMEMMDRAAVGIVERFVGAGYPTEAGAVLLIEVDGHAEACEETVARIADIVTDHGAGGCRVAADEAERQLLWKGRKAAFGAVAQLAPDYYLHDTVVPRTRLVEVLDQVYEIAARHDLVVVNVFHAGDGNLHPILAFDARRPGVLERVHAAGNEIVEASLAAGGVLSGEHGIGIEKRDMMPLLFSAHDLELQDRVRHAFDPVGLANPDKVLPSGSRCADLAPHLAQGAWV